MQRTVFILFLLVVSSLCFSQSDTIRRSLIYNDISLTTFLEDISEEYTVKVFYQEDWVKNETISGEFLNLNLSELMNSALAKTSITYEIAGNNLILIPIEDKEAFMGDIENQSSNLQKDINTLIIGEPGKILRGKKARVSGRLKDGSNGNPIIGGNIIIEEYLDGTITNTDGYYELSLRPGYYTLIYSSIGYEPQTRKIKVLGNGHLDVEIFESSIELEEIAVYAKKIDRNVTRNQMSIIEFDAKDLKEIPIVSGEKDVIKGLTFMPGVKSIGEFGSGINVRGGGEDQNLYLLEGAPLFSTTHVFGLVSVINPDAVSGISLYKGHIPANYGERVSSVMDINLKSNELEKTEMRGGIGLYSSRVMVGIPMFNNKLKIRLGGRSSYSSFILTKLKNYELMNSKANFYDLNAMVNWSTKNDHFSFSAYKSQDYFSYFSEIKYTYGNENGSLKWAHNFNSVFKSDVILAYSKYEDSKDEVDNQYYEFRETSDVEYKSAKLNLGYFGFENHKIEGGVKIITYRINPGSKKPLSDISLYDEEILEDEQAIESALYLSEDFKMSQRISLSMGLRYSLYAYLGPKNIYNYQEGSPREEVYIEDAVFYDKNERIAEYSGLEPRVSLKFQLSNQNSIKLSYNRSYQYLNLLSNTSISTPNDVWKLADNYIKPLKSDQLAIGYYHNFFNNYLETSLELYYKDLRNFNETKNDARLSMNDHIETEVINAFGRNYGIELLIKKNFGVFDGWLSYSYSRSLRKTDGKFPAETINDNEYYPSSFDKPHDLSFIANYHVNKRVKLSMNFSYSTGRPVTLPEYQFPSHRNRIVYFSDRNKYRLPDYHRLDISVSIDESLRKAKKWKGSWTFSILNLYGRKNPYSVFYQRQDPTFVNDFRTFSMYKLYIIGRPFPTVTYNFIF